MGLWHCRGRRLSRRPDRVTDAAVRTQRRAVVRFFIFWCVQVVALDDNVRFVHLSEFFRYI